MRKITLLLTWTAAACLSVAPAGAQEGVRWQTNLEAAKRQAAESNRLVILHFWATWCGPCVRLDADVFTKPGVGPALEAAYVPVKVRVDESAQTSALVEKYGVKSLPWDVVIRPTGEKVADFNSPRTVDAYVGKMMYVAQTALPGRQQLAAQQTVGAADPYATPNAPTVPVAYGAPAVGGRQPQPDAIAPPVAAQFAANSPPPQYWPAGNQAAAPQQGAYQQGAYQQAGAYQPPQYQAPPLAQPVQEAAPTPSFRDAASNNGAAFGHAVPSTTASYSPPPAALNAPNNSSPVNNSPVNEPPASNFGAQPAATGAVAVDMSLYGLDGYCPVHLAEQSSWTPGDYRLYAVHGGKTYFFAGESCREKFLANPERYCPLLGGADPVAYLERNQSIPGSRRHGCFLGKGDQRRIVLFASEESLTTFEREPAKYAMQLKQAVK